MVQKLLAITNDKIDDSSDNSVNNKENKRDVVTIKPLNVEKYVTRTFPFSEVAAAIKCAAERSTKKNSNNLR